MPDERPSRDDVAAAIGARRELGPEYQDAVVDSFLAGVEKEIDRRVDARVAERLGDEAALRRGRERGDPALVLGFVSLGTGIPITAISASEVGFGGLLVSWAGIAAVNIAHAWSRRRTR
ncbi:MAG: hypothetical protein ICV70_05840 [Jiangellaceae bacterium]|nr:hypothetical protein [Jiangellaceae bacterium]